MCDVRTKAILVHICLCYRSLEGLNNEKLTNRGEKPAESAESPVQTSGIANWPSHRCDHSTSDRLPDPHTPDDRCGPSFVIQS